ncbi:hypothetical protein M0R45_025746 [Rubus argutus]|uniref:non-specific serine/threonine protein kinase n=1 Tax=Rubus argutus TaxID=59490 RepID=A0AAW1WYW5_RUBAR
MDQRTQVFLLLIFAPFLVLANHQTGGEDVLGLNSLKALWTNTPASWGTPDPCHNGWDGIGCTNARVVTLTLSSMNLTGTLSGDIQQLSELQILDLSYNKGLTGPLPEEIGSLKKLFNIILVGCSFSGLIPPSIGSLQELVFLSLNSNRFNGKIPSSIGNLSKLYWLDLADNNLEGPIPVSNGGEPGLDMLSHCKHFHLGMNELSGQIPPKLFSSNMSLIHVLFERNKLSGSIPSSLGFVKSLEVVRFDSNMLSGSIPVNLNNLTTVSQLLLSNNKLGGPAPDLTGMIHLQYVDLSNNSFDASDVPPWFSTLESLTTLKMESTQLQGEIPAALFSLPNLQTVVLKNNQLNGILDIGTGDNPQLELIDLQNNLISAYNGGYNGTLILVQNPICTGKSLSYCKISNSADVISYETLSKNCVPSSCTSDQLSNQTFKPQKYFGPFYFIGDDYQHFAVETEVPSESKKSSNVGIIVGAAAGGSVLVLILLLVGVYAIRQKRKAKRATDKNNPFGKWDVNKSSGGIPQLKGARSFTFEELMKFSNNFSEVNDVGSGGYGKVYRGTLPTGQLIAIKRAHKESTQGGYEFKTEIELLSRVHHKNLVSLVGFCFDQGEQMLVYEYVANGTLKDSLSGKSGIRLDWTRRLKIVLGAARGISYLHELCDPPIVHRDIKSTNVLLDNSLTAKVADFGLSKTMDDSGRDHVSTQVKGTMGYLDPEYYMTQRLTEKSDVYGFGVLMLELLTARRPIEQGKYIVREICDEELVVMLACEEGKS